MKLFNSNFSDYFYNDEITIYSKTNTKDIYKISKENITEIETVKCDIQDITKELALKTFGYQDEFTLQIFLEDNSNINTGTIISTVINEEVKFLKVLSKLDYGYLNILVGDYNGNQVSI